MSRRPEQAAPDGARLNDPSRRAILGYTAVAPMTGALSASAPEPTTETCNAWLACRAETERLSRLWQQIENAAFQDPTWVSLTRAQRRSSPQQHEMDNLYDLMDELRDQDREILAGLPTMIASTPAGIAGKLAVAAAEVCPEDNKDAHLLIASILRDFRALTGV
jgi:hypothetical protein